jgi:hypothetical protein
MISILRTHLRCPILSLKSVLFLHCLKIYSLLNENHYKTTHIISILQIIIEIFSLIELCFFREARIGRRFLEVQPPLRLLSLIYPRIAG